MWLENDDSAYSVAIDLCWAPGSWSQLLKDYFSHVVGIDLQDMWPISDNFSFIKGDITSQETCNKILSCVNDRYKKYLVDKTNSLNTTSSEKEIETIK